MNLVVHVTSFYRFTPLSEDAIASLKSSLEEISLATGLRGLVLMGPEGVNATLSGALEAMDRAKKLVHEAAGVSTFKDSVTDRHPFNYFRVKVKDEIVTMGQPGVVPKTDLNRHLTPEEWQRTLDEEDLVVLDTRNNYET
jgi:UPF0176 protein